MSGDLLKATIRSEGPTTWTVPAGWELDESRIIRRSKEGQPVRRTRFLRRQSNGKTVSLVVVEGGTQ